jgi:hypothetical protein
MAKTLKPGFLATAGFNFRGPGMQSDIECRFCRPATPHALGSRFYSPAFICCMIK